MKLTVKLFCLFLALPFVMAAQEKSADDFKNEGNEFVRAKDFKSALASYEQAITLWGDSLDAATVYAAADCARRTKQADKAQTFYQKSIELDYKADFATYYLSDILKDAGKDAEMEALLVSGLEKYTSGPAASAMKKTLVGYYLKQGLEPYNEAGKILATTATAKPEEYEAITAKANEKFAEARPFVEKALALDGANENAKKMMSEIISRLGK